MRELRAGGGPTARRGVALWRRGGAERLGVDAGRPRRSTERHGALAAAGDLAYVEPDEPAAHGRIVTVRADGPGSATLGRLMANESGRRVPRAANPGRPDMEGTRANETMMCAVAVFVWRSEAQAPVTTGRRPEAADGASGGMSPGGGNPVVTVR